MCANRGPEGRAVMIHGLPGARIAALTARDRGDSLLLVSAPAAAGSAGAGWWRALTERLATEFPDLTITAVLDCGDAAGAVMAALQAGVRDLAFAGPEGVAVKLQSMAEQSGSRLWRSLPPALDARQHRNPAQAIADWLDRPDPA